jgi:hypothetical protein
MLLAISQPIPQAQNGPQQHNEVREQSPFPNVSAVTGPSTEIKQQGSSKEAESVWQKGFAPESWPNWFLGVVGIFGVWAALRTLKAIENQAKLQKTAMRQWIVTGNWTQGPRYTDGILTEISLQIPVVNETNYPLRLDSVVAELNGIEQIKTVRSQIAPLGRDAHILTFPIRLEGPQVSEYQQNRFILVVECRVTFVDVFEDQQTIMFNCLYRCGPQEFEQKDKYTQAKNPN